MPVKAMVNPGATGNKGIFLSSLIEGQSAKPVPSGLKKSQGEKDVDREAVGRVPGAGCWTWGCWTWKLEQLSLGQDSCPPKELP